MISGKSVGGRSTCGGGDRLMAWTGHAERNTPMQILIALVALPAVALLLALASRLEDGLRAAARSRRAPLALPAGPTSAPAQAQPSPSAPGP